MTKHSRTANSSLVELHWTTPAFCPENTWLIPALKPRSAAASAALFTMNSLPTVLLKPGEADRVIAGHPWIYQGAVLRVTAKPADGDAVQVKDHRQRFVGTGLWNSKSRIHVRVLSRDRIDVDAAFFEDRIRAALELRRKLLQNSTSFRVVNAESDFLSGLIVDKYEDVLVVQISSLGMDVRKPLIVAALQKIFTPRAIVERSDVASRKFEGLDDSRELLAGEMPAEFEVRLNKLRFVTNLAGGHKTGLYLDQQDNWRQVASLCAGGTVLDCFTFAGGFALHAAAAGASQVHGLDQSEEAITTARRNAEVNGLADKCSFEAGNVFDWLKQHTVVPPNEKLIPRYDAIILDPPSFTRNRASVPDALRGYKEIHVRALKLLKPGGVLATFCCSHHVNAGLFQDVILSAAFDTRKILRRIGVYTQSSDHPVVPSIPETEYLKGFSFELVKQ